MEKIRVQSYTRVLIILFKNGSLLYMIHFLHANQFKKMIKSKFINNDYH